MSRIRTAFRGRRGVVLSISLIVWALAVFDLTLLPRVSTPFLVKLPARELVGVKVPETARLLTSAGRPGGDDLWILNRQGARLGVIGVDLPRMHTREYRRRKMTAGLRTTVPAPRGVPVDVEDWPGTGPTLFAVSSPERSPTLRLVSLRSGRQVLEADPPLPPQESDKRNFFIAPWRGSGPDLFVVDRDAHRRKPRSRRLWTVRIYSGESDFKKLIHESKIRSRLSEKLSEPDWWMDIGYQNRRKEPNLVLVTKSRKTGTGKTEVHIISGRSGFHHFNLHAGIDFADRIKRPFLFESEKRGGTVLMVKLEGGRLSLVPVPLP